MQWRQRFAGKQVLMTGGTGFLGKNIVPCLEGLGCRVTAVGRNFDLTSSDDAMRLFSQTPACDYIFHAAALQGAGEFTLRHPGEQLYANSLIHVNALEAWRKHQPQARFIGIGSTCSYPGSDEVLPETCYLTGKLHESVKYYGLTKIVMQQGIEAYKEQYGLKGTTAVFATLFGPHDDFDLSRAHVVSALVKKFCDGKQSGQDEVEVWGDGTQSRELIYVEDQITGLLMVADYDGELINIGTGSQISIRELAERIKHLVGFRGVIAYNTNRFVGVKHKVLDITLARQLFGWTVDNKMHSLDESLTKTIAWYQKEYLSGEAV